MSVLLYEAVILFLALLIHFVIWKIHLPEKNHTIVLLRVFFWVFICGIGFFEIAPDVSILGINPPSGLKEILQLFLLHSSLTLAYIISYSAVEVDSPSLYMVLTIEKAASSGLNKEKLYALMNDAYLVEPRIKDLVEDKMISNERGVYKLTPKGVMLANLFITVRKILDLPKGG